MDQTGKPSHDPALEPFTGKQGAIALIAGLAIGIGLQLFAQSKNPEISRYLGVGTNTTSLIHTFGPLLLAYPLNYLTGRRNAFVRFAGNLLAAACTAGFVLAAFGFIAWFIGWN